MAATGEGYALSPILKPLEPVREHVNVISGLSHLQADTFGDGTPPAPARGEHTYEKPGSFAVSAKTSPEFPA